MKYAETYRIVGVLIKWYISVGYSEVAERRQINEEIEASSLQSAIDSFEIDGWEWAKTPTINLVTEAMKMERYGYPSLFPMESRK